MQIFSWYSTKTLGDLGNQWNTYGKSKGYMRKIGEVHGKYKVKALGNHRITDVQSRSLSPKKATSHVQNERPRTASPCWIWGLQIAQICITGGSLEASTQMMITGSRFMVGPSWRTGSYYVISELRWPRSWPNIEVISNHFTLNTSGWWFWNIFVPPILGISWSQVTNSYFSEG